MKSLRCSELRVTDRLVSVVLDIVEFEQGVDRRTGKAIAVAIYPMPQQTQVQTAYPVINNERVIGTIVIEAQPASKNVSTTAAYIFNSQ